MEKSSRGSSPEFEFWMVSNPPSFPQLSADELFADGLILPLLTPPPPPPPPLPLIPSARLENPNPSPETSPPKKWRQIFRPRNAKRRPADTTRTPPLPTMMTTTTCCTTSSSSSVGSSAELNIHLWPFSRSRSYSGSVVAGRPRASQLSGRRSYSAPCSRSNSIGEAPPTKRWGPLVGGGIHVGRSMPVWQLRRSGVAASAGGKRNLNLNLNSDSNSGGVGHGSCSDQVGNMSSCRGEDKDEVAGGDHTDDGRGRRFLKLRAIFSKKVVLIK